MTVVDKVARTLQALFGSYAERAAQQSEVIERRRVLTPAGLAITFVLGFLRHPKASDEALARLATEAGYPVTPSAIAQRYTFGLVTFLQQLLGYAVQHAARALQTNRTLAPVLQRFTRVELLDSSTIPLPDDCRDDYPSCGGPLGSGTAALKCQTRLDLKTGALKLELTAGRDADQTCALQHELPPKGALRITDLGYFSLALFGLIAGHQAYFLSRLLGGTKVYQPGDQPDDPPQELTALLAWLEQQPGPLVDVQVLLGVMEQLPCRLLAWRIPEEQANRRRQALYQSIADKKKGRRPSAESLARCSWTLLITNASRDLLRPNEAIVLYRARWQIELLFKRWKSLDLLALRENTSSVRRQVRVWSRLLACVVQHWLVVMSAWHDVRQSWWKVWEACREWVGRLVDALPRRPQLRHVLQRFCTVTATTCHRQKRGSPSTAELLENPDLLDYFDT